MRYSKPIWIAALAASTLGLSALGLAVQWSIARGEPYLGDGLWVKHSIWLVVGVVAAAAAAAIPPGWWRKSALPLYGVGLAALVAVAAGLGPELGGARRWLSLGPLFVHVAALFNVPLVLGLARTTALDPLPIGAGWPARAGRLIGEAILVAAAVLLPVVLLYTQPDLVGAAGVLVVSVAMLASSRRTWIPAALLGAITLAAPPVVWKLLMHVYQKERILDFFSDHPDTLGIGYQAAVAQDMLRSGGLMGRGFTSASADGLERLSNARTDFALSVVGHEWGIAGMAAVLALAAVVVAAAVCAAIRSPDRFSSRLVLGCGLVIALQAGLHTAVNLGLLPVVSTPGFPLVSYGGSATVAALACVGIVVRTLLLPSRDAGASTDRATSRGT